MSVDFQFNAATVAPAEGTGDALPRGWYDLMVVASEAKATNGENGAGVRLVFTCEVTTGFYKGRKCFAGFNVENPNAQTQQIAYEQLSALQHAVGVLDMKNTGQLHGIAFRGKLSYRPATEQYEAQNDFKSFKNAQHNVDVVLEQQANPANKPAIAGPAQQPMAPPQQSAGMAPQQPAQPAAMSAGAPPQPWNQGGAQAQPPAQQPQAAPQQAAQQMPPQQAAPQQMPPQQAPAQQQPPHFAAPQQAAPQAAPQQPPQQVAPQQQAAPQPQAQPAPPPVAQPAPEQVAPQPQAAAPGPQWAQQAPQQ